VSDPQGVYLGATRDLDRATAVVWGIPYDGGTSYRAGARAAPDEIRAASQSLETYSPRLKRDLEDYAFADAGDLALAGLDAAAMMERIAETVEAHERAGRLVVSLGGDHSVSIGTTAGSRRAREGVGHIVFDAHLDMRESYHGSELSHACGTRHMAKAGPTIALGIRSGSRDEFADADAMLAYWSDDVSLPGEALDAVAGRPVHISIDLDVLDPSILPGTGTPEPGGCSYKELREAVLSLAVLEVVAVDLVEVAPPLDASGVSTVVAAELCREIILAFAKLGRG
jgi:agmatinase